MALFKLYNSIKMCGLAVVFQTAAKWQRKLYNPKYLIHEIYAKQSEFRGLLQNRLWKHLTLDISGQLDPQWDTFKNKTAKYNKIKPSKGLAEFL